MPKLFFPAALVAFTQITDELKNQNGFFGRIFVACDACVTLLFWRSVTDNYIEIARQNEGVTLVTLLFLGL